MVSVPAVPAQVSTLQRELAAATEGAQAKQQKVQQAECTLLEARRLAEENEMLAQRVVQVGRWYQRS